MKYSPLPRKVMTVREVADYLKLHPSTVYRLLKTGELPGFHVGSDWRFNIEAVDQWRLSRPTARTPRK